MSNDRDELKDEEFQKIAGENSQKMVIGIVRLQIPGGNATSEPPIEPALSIYGVDISKFLDEFNERTREYEGEVVPTVITIYADHSFSFVTKEPPASLKFTHKTNTDPEARIGKVDYDTLKNLIGKK